MIALYKSKRSIACNFDIRMIVGNQPSVVRKRDQILMINKVALYQNGHIIVNSLINFSVSVY